MAIKYSSESEKIFIIIITTLFLILSFIVIKEIIILIIFSFILAYFISPIYNYFLKYIKNERICSILTLFSATSIIFIPIILLIYNGEFEMSNDLLMRNGVNRNEKWVKTWDVGSEIW